MAKILLVEDDTNLSEIYQARMEAEGYTVVSASDGESALALAAKEKPDLILSDVMMPKISGFEMLDILRNTEGLKHTKVIMLTALGQAEDQARAQSLGADKYLVKSQVTLEDIVSAAQELLGDGQQAQPTPAELAMPVVNAAPAAAPDPAADPQATTEPDQAAPTGPLAATTPANPVVSPVVSEPATPPADPPTVTAAPADSTTPESTEPIAPTPVDPPADPDEETPVEDAKPPAVEVAATAVVTEPEPTTEIAPLTEVMSTPAEDASTETTVSAPVDPEPAPQPQAEAAQEPVTEPTPEPEPAVEPEPVATESEEPAASDDAESSAPAPVPTPALEEEPQQAASSAEATTPDEPVAEEVTEPAEAPATKPANEVPATTAAIDERVVSNAIDKLLAKSPESANVEADVSPSGTERPHKKVIAPIPHAVEPSLQELLAKEEAKSGTIAPTIKSADGTPTIGNAPAVAATDEDDAAATLAEAQATKAKAQAKDGEFDPNSISL